MANCDERVMPSTVKKIKRQLVITTNHGDTFTISDTDECSSASLTLAEFKRNGILTFDVDEYQYFVPASSVDSIQVEILTDSE